MVPKGSSFERKICKQLSQWWTEGEKDDVFWRTAGSGSRATVRGKRGKDTTNSAGDIGYIDEIGKPLIDLFVIELKRGYSRDISILDFIDSRKRKPLLEKWWMKAYTECTNSKRFSYWIIFQRDNHTPVLLLPQQAFAEIELYHTIYPHVIVSISNYNCFISFDRFLDWCTPDGIRMLAQDWSKRGGRTARGSIL